MYSRRTIIEVARDVFEKYMKKYRKKYKDVNREVGDLMRGPMIETEVRRVRDAALREGEIRGEARGEARGEIRGYIELGLELELSRADTKERVIMRFKVDEDEAEEKMQEFWIEK